MKSALTVSAVLGFVLLGFIQSARADLPPFLKKFKASGAPECSLCLDACRGSYSGEAETVAIKYSAACVSKCGAQLGTGVDDCKNKVASTIRTTQKKTVMGRDKIVVKVNQKAMKSPEVQAIFHEQGFDTSSFGASVDKVVLVRKKSGEMVKMVVRTARKTITIRCRNKKNADVCAKLLQLFSSAQELVE